MEDNKDVDLYDELKKELAKSEEEESPVASDQKPKEEIDTSKPKVEDENVELSDEDISKLTPRAQKRIREQAAEITRLQSLEDKNPKDIPADKDTSSPEFKNVSEFLDAVQDKDSRNLLEKFYKTIKGEMSETLSPIEQKNNEVRFETEFAKYEKIDGLADYKSDLQKTFLKNPSQDMKALIGSIVLDLQTSKVKPVDDTPSSPNRGKVDVDSLSKDQLYDMLDSTRG